MKFQQKSGIVDLDFQSTGMITQLISIGSPKRINENGINDF